MSTDLDVVIIGGGVQGLLALDTLTERGSESRTGHPARRQWGGSRPSAAVPPLSSSPAASRSTLRLSDCHNPPTLRGRLESMRRDAVNALSACHTSVTCGPILAVMLPAGKT